MEYAVDGSTGYIRTYNGRGRHGWVEIDMNGTTYVFDLNFEYGGYGNGYQINYGMLGTFKYIDYARVDERQTLNRTGNLPHVQ